jgi:YD repeat-containing protein
LADLIISISSSTSFKQVHINRGDGSGWEYDSNYVIPVHFVVNEVDQGVRLVDVTNDGYPDLVMSRTDATYPSGIRKVYVNNGDGTGWSDYGTVSIPKDFVSYGHETGVRLADVTGDGILDLVEALDDGNPPNDEHKNVYPNTAYGSVDTNYPDYLTGITTAQGEEVSVKYLASPLYKDGSGDLYNPHLPLVLNTVHQIIRKDGFGNVATTTYSYSNGEYFFESPHKRRFAGFASTTKTDIEGNVTKSFYHQGNGSLSSIGEYNDDFSKIGKPYRIEVYDDGGHLYSRKINRWENVGLGNDRDFVHLARTLTFTYDGDSDHREVGTTFAYSTTSGNLIEKVEYGEVSGSNDGTFTDTGTDKRTTTYSFAASTTPHILGALSREILLDQASSTVKDTKQYYDNLALGNVDVGNETKTEFWKDTSNYASTTKTYNSYGLVTQERDARSNATTYTYDSLNLYVATSTNALSQQTQFYYDYSLGKPRKTIDPNGREFETVYDGLDRPVTEKQPDFGTPGASVTKKTYAYTDTQASRKIVKTNHLDSSTDFTLYTYLDGMDRVIQTRRETEDSGWFAARDTVYNRLGQVERESLPYNSSGSSRTSATADSALYTRYSYDPLGRLTTAANASGRREGYPNKLPTSRRLPASRPDRRSGCTPVLSDFECRRTRGSEASRRRSAAFRVRPCWRRRCGGGRGASTRSHRSPYQNEPSAFPSR